MIRSMSCFFSLLVGIVVFILMPSAAYAQNDLAWKTFRLEGYYNGPGSEKGIADKILDYYIEHLPEYAHDIQEVPIVRLFSTMAEITDGAYLGPGKTRLPPHQMSRVLSSTIHLVMPPPGIVIRKADLNTKFSGDNLSMGSLLNERGNIVMCWFRGATYHPGIRKAVEDYIEKNQGNHPNVYMLSQIHENRFKMLEHGRIDYFPDHAISFQYGCSRQDRCPEEISFLNVSEAREDVYTYTFAADTELGSEIIRKINKIHESDDYRSFLRGLISQHFPPSLADIYIDRNMELVGKEMR